MVIYSFQTKLVDTNTHFSEYEAKTKLVSGIKRDKTRTLGNAFKTRVQQSTWIYEVHCNKLLHDLHLKHAYSCDNHFTWHIFVNMLFWLNMCSVCFNRTNNNAYGNSG